MPAGTQEDGDIELSSDADEDGDIEFSSDADGDGDTEFSSDADGDGDTEFSSDADGDGDTEFSSDADGDGDIEFSSDTEMDEDTTENDVSEGYTEYPVHDTTVTGLELHDYFGYTDIRSLSYSPDGSLLAVASGQGVILFNTSDGSVHKKLFSDCFRVLRVKFSPDGSMLASAEVRFNFDTEKDHISIKVWNASNWSLKYSIEIGQYGINSLDFTSDSALLTCDSDTSLNFYNTSDGSLNKAIELPARPIYVDISPDDSLVAVAVNRGYQLYNLQTSELLHTSPDYWCGFSVLTFSHNGEMLATGGSCYQIPDITLWNVSEGTIIKKLTVHTDSIISLKFSLDDTFLYGSAYDATLKFWRLSDYVCTQSLEGEYYYSLELSPDGQHLAYGDTGHTVWVRNAADASVVHEIYGHTDHILDLDISRDCSTVVSGSVDDTIIQWNIADGSKIKTLIGHENEITHLSIHPNNHILASVAVYETGIQLWSLFSGEVLRKISGISATASLGMSPDGSFLVAGGSTTDDGKHVYLYSMSDYSVRVRIPVTYQGQQSMAISQDSSLVVLGGTDDYTEDTPAHFRVHNARSGALIKQLEASKGNYFSKIAISPDNKNLAGVSQNRGRLVFMRDDTEVALEILDNNWATDVAFSPNGSVLAVSITMFNHNSIKTFMKVIRLYRVSDGNVIATIQAHSKKIRSIKFSADGNWFVSGSEDGTIGVWKVLY